MYIISCRAHFCHLLGLGQVGHSPRETSGSDGTLDWGPMWSGSQSTCPNTPLHPLTAPYTPRRPPMPSYVTYILLAPEYLHSLPAPIHHLMPPNGPNTPYTPEEPQCPLMPPIPLLACEYLHSLPAPHYTPDTP